MAGGMTPMRVESSLSSPSEFKIPRWVLPLSFLLVVLGTFNLIGFGGSGSSSCTQSDSAIDASAANSATGKLFSGERKRKFDASSLVFQGRSPSTAATAHPGAKGNGGQSCDKWNVVTTIFDPSSAVRTAADVEGWCTVIVGDNKTPKDYLEQAKLDGRDDVVFLTAAQQMADAEQRNDEIGEFLKAVPFNHFARKNVGYLYAVRHGARLIFDFDDDNELKLQAHGEQMGPLPKGGETALKDVRVVEMDGGERAFNPYPLLETTVDNSWPRGFPLELLKVKATKGRVARVAAEVAIETIGVLQSAADHDPDIDAVHRMTKSIPFTFREIDAGGQALLVPAGTYVPYNAQATVHTASAFWAMLLPMTVPGRVSDIWRSYFAEKIFHRLGLHVAFLPPRVEQDRNAHNYLADMQAETDLYFKSGKLIEFLASWEDDFSTSVQETVERLWVDLYERTYIELGDVVMVQRWLKALEAAGYYFPSLPLIRTLNPVAPRSAPSLEAVRPPTKQGDIDLELMVVTNYKFESKYFTWLAPALRFFWTWNPIRLRVVMPEWEEPNKEFAERLRSSNLSPSVTFEPYVDPKIYNARGWNLQQRTMFYADKFISAEYVGFVDTDSTFVTQVTRKSLFIDGKPIVRGLRGVPMNNWWTLPPKQTFHVLKRKQIASFMTYFPVIVKTAHLTELRKHVEVTHGKTFDEVFQEIALEKRFSQFDIILNYLFFHHRDEYAFRIPDSAPRETPRDKRTVEKYRKKGYFNYMLNSTETAELLTEEEKQQTFHVTTHWKYWTRQWRCDKHQHRTRAECMVGNEILRGYCYSQGFREKDPRCAKFKQSDLQQAMFIFQDVVGGVEDCETYPCAELQRTHYEDVAEQPAANRLNVSILAEYVNLGNR